MDSGLLATIIQEGGSILSELIRSSRRVSVRTVNEEEVLSSLLKPIPPGQIELAVRDKPEVGEGGYESQSLREEATSIKAGCIPCALGHVGTCAGLLEEAVRFARSDGMDNDTTISRINMCLDELNTMERGDLTTQKVLVLPEWERELAEQVLVASRDTRHALEESYTIDKLKEATAKISAIRENLGKKYYRTMIHNVGPDQQKQLVKNVITGLTPEERTELAQRVIRKLEESEG